MDGWLCACGHWQGNDFHCSYCGTEPPWGCDCGMHYDEDDWETEPWIGDDDPYPDDEGPFNWAIENDGQEP